MWCFTTAVSRINGIGTLIYKKNFIQEDIVDPKSAGTSLVLRLQIVKDQDF